MPSAAAIQKDDPSLTPPELVAAYEAGPDFLMVAMKPDDYINIPAYKEHRVGWTTPDEPTVWPGARYGDYG